MNIRRIKFNLNYICQQQTKNNYEKSRTQYVRGWK